MGENKTITKVEPDPVIGEKQHMFGNSTSLAESPLMGSMVV
jgi:hypothetical protein